MFATLIVLNQIMNLWIDNVTVAINVPIDINRFYSSPVTTVPTGTQPPAVERAD